MQFALLLLYWKENDKNITSNLKDMVFIIVQTKWHIPLPGSRPHVYSFIQP